VEEPALLLVGSGGHFVKPGRIHEVRDIISGQEVPCQSAELASGILAVGSPFVRRSNPRIVPTGKHSDGFDEGVSGSRTEEGDAGFHSEDRPESFNVYQQVMERPPGVGDLLHLVEQSVDFFQIGGAQFVFLNFVTVETGDGVLGMARSPSTLGESGSAIQPGGEFLLFHALLWVLVEVSAYAMLNAPLPVLVLRFQAELLDVTLQLLFFIRVMMGPASGFAWHMSS
jgi:hypothetical protein